MKTLVLAEKPSVARDIARVLGVNSTRGPAHEDDRWVVTSALGHLLELAPPEAYDPGWKRWRLDVLPMVPAKFQLVPVKKTSAHLAGLKKLLSRRDVGLVVNACDAGREGELIFRYIYRHTGCQKPVKRLWLSENTPAAVQAAFGRLRDASEMANLGTAAELRACADWLVGINCTRAYTVRHAGYGNVLSVGRVQTPTLAMLVEREREIRTFVPTPYWQVTAQFSTAGGETYAGTWMDGDRDRFASPEEARRIQEALAGCRQARVAKVEKKDKQEPPPQLYDLTSLQRDANRKYGLTAKQTLDAAQALYERHKLLTYPRTDSRHLTRALAASLADRVNAVTSVPEWAGFKPAKTSLTGKRFVDDAKVTDHHAVIPTATVPDTAVLGKNEKAVYDLVVRRFLAAFFPPYRYRQSVVTTLAREEPFVSKGRVDLAAGWRVLYGRDEDAEPTLPELAVGERVSLDGAEVVERTTKPPKRYTEATLLGAMEHAGRQVEDEEMAGVLKEKGGIGTPATRAAIIERLIQVSYVVRQARELLPTPKGEALIDLVDVRVKSPELTAAWERELAAVERGTLGPGAFWRGIVGLAGEIVAAVGKQPHGVVPAAPPKTKGKTRGRTKSARKKKA